MVRRVKSHTALGMGLAAIGMVSLSLGLARAPLLPNVFGLQGWVAATAAGFVVLLVGMLVIIFAGRVAEESPDIVPATVAFASRQAQEMPRPPIRTDLGTVAAGSPASAARRSMDARELALFRMDEEIRDLTRRINKAGVMLAMGQLSDEGYAHYVEDLKRQRGQLEASRVRLELNRPAR